VALGAGFGLKGADRRLDWCGAADGWAGGGQDVAYRLAGGFKASYGYPVVQVPRGEGRDEGETEPGGDEALGGPVFVGLNPQLPRSLRGSSGCHEVACGLGCPSASVNSEDVGDGTGA
jgi:hypothetical protein